jgi:hypothetical protein
MPIKQQDARCWVLNRDPDGYHWPTHAIALEHADADEIQQLPGACWVASCGDCDEPFGDDDQFSELHFEDRASLVAAATDFDWTLVGDDFRCEAPAEVSVTAQLEER